MRPPVPGSWRVQDSQWRFAGRTRGLVEPGVPIERVGQVGPERWPCELVFGQFGLGRERQRVEVGPGCDASQRAELTRVERVARQDFLEQRPQAVELEPAKLLAR